MLQNAYFLAKIGADTAENEQHFAEKRRGGRRGGRRGYAFAPLLRRHGAPVRGAESRGQVREVVEAWPRRC